MSSEKLFTWLQSGPGSQQGAGTKSRMRLLRRDQTQDEAPEPGQNPSSATIRKHDFCVISRVVG